MSLPVALASSIVISRTTEPGAVSGQLAGYDPDYEASVTYALAAGEAPRHGTITIAPDGSYVYTPKARYLGTDEFSFSITDEDGGTATATVGVTVAKEAPASIMGTDGGDLLIGGKGDNTIDGGAWGYGSMADLIYGGGGRDTLTGGLDADLYGGKGDDRLMGGGYGAALYGEAGDDDLNVWAGVAYGGAGDDTLIGSAGAGLHGGKGHDRLAGSNLYGEAGNDVLEVSPNKHNSGYGDGGDGHDTLIGSGYSELYGGNGNDRLTGGVEQDGGAGHDVLELESGMWFVRAHGGAGNDVFEFASPSDEGGEVFISDFSNARGDNDVVHISAEGFGGGLTAGAALSASRFQVRADNLAQDSNDRFIFRTTDATLWFDSNGDASGGLALVADLNDTATMTSADIFLV